MKVYTLAVFGNEAVLRKLDAQHRRIGTVRRAHTKSSHEGKMLRSLRCGSRQRLLTGKQESGGIIMGVSTAILLARLDRCSGAFMRVFT